MDLAALMEYDRVLDRRLTRPTFRRDDRIVSAELNRRSWLAAVPAALTLAASAGSAGAAPPPRGDEPVFTFGLNTSTISGQKLPIDGVVAIAAKAGYRAIEPWIRELEAYKSAGKSLDDLRKQIVDSGIAVVSSIGFAEWAVDDEGRRKRGLEQLKRDMELVRTIGGLRIAAPPVGLTDRHESDTRKLAERYRAICEIGDGIGVVPQVEVWGPSKTLCRLGEAAALAIESGHPKACILPDVYHLYKGGSGHDGVRLLAPRAIHVMHMNDYPAEPTRLAITDAHRVYPGEGVAPLSKLLRDLRDGGFRITLSLELFNRDLWKRDAAEVAATGLAKMKAAVAAAIG
jgi:2-keto-myo-inositol isomerase